MKVMRLFMLLMWVVVLAACQEAKDFKLDSISESKLAEKVESNETFLLVIGEKYCSSCQDYQQTTIKTYLELDEHLPVYYVDTLQIGDLEAFLAKYNLSYQTSPTTYYFTNAQVKDHKVNVMSLEELQAFIEQQ
jgi:predicted bacteriocin transport accessory protein